MASNLKLSYSKARQIREKYESLRKELPHPQAVAVLAEEFGVHRRSIDRVVYNDAWVVNFAALKERKT